MRVNKSAEKIFTHYTLSGVGGPINLGKCARLEAEVSRRQARLRTLDFFQDVKFLCTSSGRNFKHKVPSLKIFRVVKNLKIEKMGLLAKLNNNINISECNSPPFRTMTCQPTAGLAPTCFHSDERSISKLRSDVCSARRVFSRY